MEKINGRKQQFILEVELGHLLYCSKGLPIMVFCLMVMWLA